MNSCDEQTFAFVFVVAGDFWHLRGALRVDVLNAVMAQLAQWTVPVCSCLAIMTK
jgi:hypothetical protein